MPKYLRKVIKISAADSPNVRVALAQQARGEKPTGDSVVPGVIDWATYQHRRLTWDQVRQCVGLDGEFYEGAENLLYPPEWLNKAEQYAQEIQIRKMGHATSLGIDTAEGGDDTSWAVCSEKGLHELISMKTPDTSVIVGRTIGIMQRYGINPDNVMLDQGGGGKEHADQLRARGYPVHVVSFGESVAPEPVRFLKPWEEKQDDRRERFTFKNRRAQMYWMLHLRLDPLNAEQPFAIPAEYTELRRQLAVMPLWYDEEGRIMLPPKNRRPGAQQTTIKTISEMLGRSPDDADALVLAVYAMDPGSKPVTLRPMF
jgi:hypothetical protein